MFTILRNYFTDHIVRIVTCIVQVNMQAFWDLPKPSDYSHDVLQSCYRYIACVGIIINLV